MSEGTFIVERGNKEGKWLTDRIYNYKWAAEARVRELRRISKWGIRIREVRNNEKT